MFASLWRYKWYIAGVALVAGAAVFGLSLLQGTVYEAEGTVLLNDPRSSGGIASDIGLVLDPSRYVRNQAEVMESPQVAARAAALIDDGTTAIDVQDSVTTNPSTNLDTVTITARAETADRSVDLVVAVETAYEQIISEQILSSVDASIATLEATKGETEARIAELDALIAANPDDVSLEAQRTAAISRLVAIDNRIEQLSTNAALYGSGVQLFVEPETPTTPVQPRPLRNAVAAFIVGGLAAGTWAWWHAERNQVANDRNAPASILDAPLLATVPEFKSAGAKGPTPTLSGPASGAAEAYQFALSSLRFALDAINGRVVLITSTSPGDGKSVTALNLAIAATLDEAKPVLVDADERAKGLTRMSSLSLEPDESDRHGNPSANHLMTLWHVGPGTDLAFVPARTDPVGNTPSYYRSNAFRGALTALLRERDLVIIDSPPVMAAAETADLASLADAIVVVVSEGTPLRHLSDAHQRLAMSGTPVIGYIFNKATSKSGGNGYGYGYGYGT